MKNLKRKYYKFLSFLTGAITALSIISYFFKTDGKSLSSKLEDSWLYYPLTTSVVVWIVLILITFLVLLFRKKSREDAFLIVSNTEPKDELEQVALNDAIKSTFIFNIVIFGLVYLLSGLTISQEYQADDGEKRTVHATIRIPPDYSKKMDVDQQKEFLMEGKTWKPSAEVKAIPKSFYSPAGLLIIILTQLVSFKFFLFLNRRALQ